jgi:hypothetical protein
MGRFVVEEAGSVKGYLETIRDAKVAQSDVKAVESNRAARTPGITLLSRGGNWTTSQSTR